MSLVVDTLTFQTLSLYPDFEGANKVLVLQVHAKNIHVIYVLICGLGGYWMFLAPSNSRERVKILIRAVPKTTDHIQIKINIPNSSEEPPASSKVPNQDLKDMDVLCTFKIKIESQNFEHRCIKDQ